jgi:hypothetical protein
MNAMVPPTPGQLVDELVERFGPPTNPDNPMIDQKDFARKRLVSLAFIAAYGKTHPMAQLVKLHSDYERDITPTYERLEDRINRMQEIWAKFEQGLLDELEATNGN